MWMQAKEAAKKLDAEQAGRPARAGRGGLPVAAVPPARAYSGMNRFNKGDSLQLSSADDPSPGLGNLSCLG